MIKWRQVTVEGQVNGFADASQPLTRSPTSENAFGLFCVPARCLPANHT